MLTFMSADGGEQEHDEPDNEDRPPIWNPTLCDVRM